MISRFEGVDDAYEDVDDDDDDDGEDDDEDGEGALIWRFNTLGREFSQRGNASSGLFLHLI